MLKQELQILRDLKKGKKITALDALNRYGCMRLAARIWDIKDRGYAVKKVMVERGEARVAQYYL